MPCLTMNKTVPLRLWITLIPYGHVSVHYSEEGLAPVEASHRHNQVLVISPITQQYITLQMVHDSSPIQW
jgi:hypothetical protein